LIVRACRIPVKNNDALTISQEIGMKAYTVNKKTIECHENGRALNILRASELTGNGENNNIPSFARRKIFIGVKDLSTGELIR
jgi:hypothetical protein